MAKRHIVLVGGGTGGHFYPLIAIAESLIETADGEQGLYYFGPDTYDEKALRELNIRFLYVPSGKQRRYRSFRNVIDVFKLLLGIFFALIRLLWIYPDVVMSKGGYTSVPVTIAAKLLRIPVVVHESDAVAGRANALAAHFAKFVAISYPDSAGAFPPGKTVLTGIPVRKSLLREIQPGVREHFKIDPHRHILLILGGSQGAERINTLVLEALDELLPQYAVLHQTGKRPYESVIASSRQLVTDAALLQHYRAFPFLDAETLGQFLHYSSLVISRAGSGSIYEIALHGKPSILIPIPGEISHDQRTNAYAYARTGAAVVMEEDNLRDGLLEAEIARIMNDQQLYAGMCEAARSFARGDAAAQLAAMLRSIADSHG